ncbi:MAG: alpha/beta hydrolase, partial [Thiomonas sp.]
MRPRDAAMSRPVLMLLPGLLCDAAVWESQGVDLHGIADCRVPDYGLRDSIDSMAEHVLEVAPPGPFALAGHSMGGRVALAVIARATAGGAPGAAGHRISASRSRGGRRDRARRPSQAAQPRAKR